MAEYQPDNNAVIPTPVFQTDDISARNRKHTVPEHLETIDIADRDRGNTKHEIAGISVIRQQHTIPTTGSRKTTTKWEYIFFCCFYFSLDGAPIGGNGGALRQLLVNEQFPNNEVQWGGQTQPLNSWLLDMTGIMFAAQLVTLLIIGPFADYGNWRPWILIISQSVLYICQFAMCAFSKPSQWQAANAIYIIGNLAANIANCFYGALFPMIVRDLPKLIQSEREVAEGTKSPKAHADLDAYERSKLYNLVNITGSALVVITYGIAVGISAGIGFSNNHKLIESYRVLMGYFGFITFITTVPFFIVQNHRPGQLMPEGTKWWKLGPQQVWSAMKSAAKLKHCMLYLIAYFLLQETFGTFGNMIGLLQNEVIHYSPLLLNAMSLVADLSGGSGTVFMLVLQKKFRFSVKAGVFYGACMTLIPSLWGGIGYFNGVVGFHHVWEFWLAQAWNFQTAAWGSYQTTMITEVIPAPKAFMFFAMFNCVSKTSGFIGPFVSSAIIARAGGDSNACFWFLFGMGSVGAIILWFVDTDKAKKDIEDYLQREAEDLYSEEQRMQVKWSEMQELETKVVV